MLTFPWNLSTGITARRFLEYNTETAGTAVLGYPTLFVGPELVLFTGIYLSYKEIRANCIEQEYPLTL